MPIFGNNGTVKARRCTICSLNYPPFVEVCRICDSETWPMYKSGPDEDWESRVAQSLGEATPTLEPPKIAFVRPHPADASIPLGVAENRLWLGHDDLLGVGYKSMEPDTIVFVGGRFYELQAYSQSRNAWWVEEIETDGAADDLHPSMFEEWYRSGGGSS